ncbi:MAG TPA: methyltransferase domain-containing protein [Micropepsaceae bacterium]|jgi:SAM-dependent methyltransferase|nr:methyltransferase domain-containing protein [Micropepsaceae bacterium]
MSAGPPRIFDSLAYRARRARAALRAGDIFLARDAADQIATRLGAINRRFERGLDLHSRLDVFGRLRPFAEDWVRTGFAWDAPSVIAEEEALPFAEESFDLVTSILSLHAINDLPGALVQIRRALKPDGLFIAALFGGETLRELKIAFAAAEADVLGGVSPRVAPFADVRDLGGLLSRAGFALPVADVERTVVRYRELSRLFVDLRCHGETNALAGRGSAFLSPRLLAALTREYATRFGDPEGRFPATFDIVFLTGWAPHESQQKPLRPSSAKTRLADALGTKEQPTGDLAPRQKRE